MKPFPASLSDITLGQWIDYTNSLQPLDEHLKYINELPECQRKGVMLTGNMVSRAYHTYAFFGGVDAPVVDDVLKEYNEHFCGLFDVADFTCIHLPSYELTETSPITFGQFIDAKMITSNGGNSWELLRYVASIFYGVEKYDDNYTTEGSDKYISTGDIPMDIANAISKWWEALNTYINENYTLFQDSGEDGGANMKEHMERWGWVNFLKSIAKTKAFDIDGSGLNSIDAARKTKCATVLIWASEEKDYNTALSRDMEASYQK